MSIEAVQSRIAELQATLSGGFTIPDPASASNTSPASTASSLAQLSALTGTPETGTDFASLLSSVTGTNATTATSTTTGTSTGPTGTDLVNAAEKYIGTPYVWGGQSLSQGGFDCSGLVLRALTDIGAGDGVPRVAADQQVMAKGETVASLAQAKPGDLLFFHNPASHVGIYIGNGKMIDAPHKGATVGIHDVWSGGPSTIRRVLPTATPTASVTSPTATSSTDLNVSALLSQLVTSQFASAAATTAPSTSGLSS